MNPQSGDSKPTVLPIVNRFPDDQLPVIFCDGVYSLANTQEVVKFYLARTQPAIDGSMEFQQMACAQVVMPLEAFATTVGFLNKRVEAMVAANKIAPQRVAELQSKV